MSTHATHEMHENSLQAYRQTAPARLTRTQVIMQWIAGRGPVTDRQVMQGLGFSDPNKVRPRITELVDLGDLVECGRTREDGHQVRRVKIAPRQLELIA